MKNISGYDPVKRSLEFYWPITQEICLHKRGFRQLCPCFQEHLRREVYAPNRTAFSNQTCRQVAGADTEVKSLHMGCSVDQPYNFIQHLLVTLKGKPEVGR